MKLLPTAIRIGFGVLLFAAIVVPALSQDASVYFSMRNQIGLLDHCWRAGHLDAQQVAKGRQQVAVGLGVLAGPKDPALGDKAEALGREGKWGQMGMAIEQRAKVFDQSVADFCKELAE